jgi:hypothetical protein
MIMDKEVLESLLVDYIDGKLDEEQRKLVELEVSNNEEAYRVYEQLQEVMRQMDRAPALEPGRGLKSRFDDALNEEIRSKKKAKTVSLLPSVYKIAAAVALVISGVALGLWFNKVSRQEQELMALRKEMAQTKQLMMAMLDNSQSASQRIRGVNVALGIKEADDEVVKALANAMKTDPNTNVRLAALDALSNFIDEQNVRSILINALSQQDDPMVQIALIQLMVKMKEKGVVKDLENIIDNEESIQAVKDEAYTGLMELS